MANERIQWQPYVHCGQCDKLEDGISSRRPGEDLRRRGWGWNKVDGWVCPDCCAQNVETFDRIRKGG